MNKLKLILLKVFTNKDNFGFEYIIATEPHKAKELTLEAMKLSYNKALDDVLGLVSTKNPLIHVTEIKQLKIK